MSNVYVNVVSYLDTEHALSHTEQVPRSNTEEVAFDEDVIVLQYVFYIPGVVYHDPWWQRWYGYFECAKSYISFALDKPVKEPVPGL